jgi:hypothetical protein
MMYLAPFSTVSRRINFHEKDLKDVTKSKHCIGRVVRDLARWSTPGSVKSRLVHRLRSYSSYAETLRKTSGD